VLNTARTPGQHGNLCPGVYRLRAWARRTDNYNGFRTLACTSQCISQCVRVSDRRQWGVGGPGVRPSVYLVCFWQHVKLCSSLAVLACLFFSCMRAGIACQLQFDHLVHLHQGCCSTAASSSTTGARPLSPPSRTATSRLGPFRTHLSGNG